MPLAQQLPPGAPGTVGPPGPAGPGVPNGGTTGQVLAKASNANQDTHWVPAGGGGGGVQVATVHVSSAAILALADTPVTLVAASPGNVISVVGVTIAYIFGTTPYTIPNPSQALHVYTDSAFAEWAQTPTTGLIDQARDLQVFPISSAPVGADALTGNALILEASFGDPTLGDGTLVVTVSYFLAPTV